MCPFYKRENYVNTEIDIFKLNNNLLPRYLTLNNITYLFFYYLERKVGVELRLKLELELKISISDFIP